MTYAELFLLCLAHVDNKPFLSEISRCWRKHCSSETRDIPILDQAANAVSMELRLGKYASCSNHEACLEYEEIIASQELMK